MKTKLRRAVTEDVSSFMHIKKQLPLNTNDSSSTGGFLLGTSEETYLDFIETSHCLVAESGDKVVGFGIILPDKILRESDVWTRRHSASWTIDLTNYEAQQLCYFEQFAFLKGHKRSAVSLAYNLVNLAFGAGAQTLFTTTVNKPVLNLAAIPFIKAVKGFKAGNINETYPVVGNINSDIYLVDPEMFRTCVHVHPLYPFLSSNTIDVT
jgi:hypothetical protein